MTTFNLDKALTGHVFAFTMIFSRLGPALLQMPGFGETYVSKRIRVMLGMAISFVLTEPLLPIIPNPPAEIPQLFRLLFMEILIGTFFGAMTRLIVSTLETVGSVVAIQTGLSNATILNPALANQSPLASAFLSVTGITLVFVTGLDSYLLRSIVDVYSVFPPGSPPVIGDLSKTYAEACGSSFRVGIELASPFLIIGLLLYVAVGVMQKLMPQVQLFLIALPVQIYGGMFLLSLTVASILALWLRYFDDSIRTMFSGSGMGP